MSETTNNQPTAPGEVASVLEAAAVQPPPGERLQQILLTAAAYIRTVEALLSQKSRLIELGQVFADVIMAQQAAGVDVYAPVAKREEVLDGYLQGWAKQQRQIEDLAVEVERLRAGRLTPEEFNELCHNLHETGQPMTACEHEAACTAFRQQLFGTPAPSVADACHAHTSPD